MLAKCRFSWIWSRFQRTDSTVHFPAFSHWKPSFSRVVSNSRLLNWIFRLLSINRASKSSKHPRRRKTADFPHSTTSTSKTPQNEPNTNITLLKWSVHTLVSQQRTNETGYIIMYINNNAFSIDPIVPSQKGRLVLEKMKTFEYGN